MSRRPWKKFSSSASILEKGTESATQNSRSVRLIHSGVLAVRSSIIAHFSAGRNLFKWVICSVGAEETSGITEPDRVFLGTSLHGVSQYYLLHTCRKAQKRRQMIAVEKRRFLPVQSTIARLLPAARVTGIMKYRMDTAKRRGPLYLPGIEVLF